MPEPSSTDATVGAPAPASAIPVPTALRRPSAPLPTPEPAIRPASDPSQFGRVEPDGTVYLRAPEGEIRVGQWTIGAPEEGLAFYGRKYDDLVVELELASTRLADGRSNAEQAQVVLARVREAVAARSYVGDVAALDRACDALASAIAHAREVHQAAKAAARAASLAQREVLVAEAESLRTSASWKPTSERFAAIVEEWRQLPRADRSTEQELWKRLSAARTEFDKRRRAHYAELDTSRKAAMAAKRAIIARAEALATSTDWQGTGRQLRSLLDEWKAAPRGSRQDEERLWRKFKAAQDAFYAAKTEHDAQAEQALSANVPAKEALVAEAERLLPVTDAKAAKRALRALQDRWDAAGDLPRKERDRLEGRLRKVEDAVRAADAAAWKATSATAATDAFGEAIARLEAKRDAAVSRGDDAQAKALEAQIASTRALLGS